MTFLFYSVTSGQPDTLPKPVDTLSLNFIQLRTVKRNGEVLPEIEIEEVFIVGKAKNSRKFSFDRYQRLVYNLKRVFPYALIVRSRLEQVNSELEMIVDEKERRKYLRGVEKAVFGEYEDDVRSMTITQGRLLIKMIDRETQNTSYELIKKYRGGFSASFWQAIARIFGTNLKDEYDPFNEDFLIEMIVTEIEAGRL